MILRSDFAAAARGALQKCVLAGIAALGFTLAAPHASQAQEWPTRVVKLIVPLPPGSGADIGARLAADRLQKIWPAGVIVENRPGGDSLIAIRQVTSGNDDHVLLFGPSGAFTPHPYRQDNLGYDRATDLLPIARFSNTVVGFAVSTSLGVKTLKEFVDKAKANPGKLNIVSVPGISEMVWDNFAKTAGINVVKVPYPNLSQGASDMATERVQGFFGGLAIVQPVMQSGAARLLNVSGRERVSLVPDVPTAAEAGFPSFELEGLVGVYGPKSMSLEIRRRAGKAFADVAADPEVASRLAATAQVPNPGGADEFTAAIERQEAQVAAIAKLMNIPRKN